MKTPEKIEMPAPTAWPVVLAFGMTLVFAGMVTAASAEHPGRDFGRGRCGRMVPPGAAGWNRTSGMPVVQEEIAIADVA